MWVTRNVSKYFFWPFFILFSHLERRSLNAPTSKEKKKISIKIFFYLKATKSKSLFRSSRTEFGIEYVGAFYDEEEFRESECDFTSALKTKQLVICHWFCCSRNIYKKVSLNWQRNFALKSEDKSFLCLCSEGVPQTRHDTTEFVAIAEGIRTNALWIFPRSKEAKH